MTEPTLTERVTILEQKVNEFASLPSRVAGVELQIVHLRDEMQVGFSAVRQEMAVMRDDLRTELHRELHGIRGWSWAASAGSWTASTESWTASTESWTASTES